MSYEETVNVELEALEYTYGSSVSVLSTDPLNISVTVEPFTGEDDAQIYVRAELILSVTKDYPDRVPTIELQNVKGQCRWHDLKVAGLLRRSLESEHYLR